MKQFFSIILIVLLTLHKSSATEPFKTQKHTFDGQAKAVNFSTELPEGQYKITLILGGNAEGSSTTLKAESRRLMFENLKTKPGKTLKKVVMVDVRSPRINDSTSIKLKPRELTYVNWDNKLTLEITGERPCVKSLKIEKADKVPTIFLAGNSTVTDQENDPWASWGQMFPCFLKPNVVVANYAESGLTLASFKSQLRLEKVLSKIKPGDYVFIEFGHNDQKMNGQNDGAWKSYTDNFRFFIQEVKKKQANAVVVTSTCRRRFDESGKIVNTLGDFPEAARTIAKHENVMLIDLNAMSKDVFDALGVEPSKKAFVHYPANTYPGQDKELADNTHFSPYGAYVLAKCVVQGILNNNYKLKKYIYSDWKTFDPKNPDSLQDFKWYESPAVNVLKPDGN